VVYKVIDVLGDAARAMKLILRDLASTLDRLKRKYPTRGQDKQVTAPIHGLVQNFQSGSAEQGESVRWTRRPLYRTAMPLPGAEKAAGLLSSLPRTLAATIAGASRDPKGTAGSLDARPAVRLTFQAEDLALLHQVHDLSHWVCSIDRTMVFDHGGQSKRPIERSPRAGSNLGHRLIRSSRSTAELESMLRPVLKEHGLQTDTPHVLAMLHQLWALSGRLALKLLSAPSQRAEALGLALSYMYLAYQRVFENQAVIPATPTSNSSTHSSGRQPTLKMRPVPGVPTSPCSTWIPRQGLSCAALSR